MPDPEPIPRLVAAGTLELQDLDAGFWFEIAEGGLDAVPIVRGSDWIIPGKAGRESGERVADSLRIHLPGHVWGADVPRGQSYLANMTALRAIFDPTADPFPLTVYPAATGVGGKLNTGESATLNVRFLRFVGPTSHGDQWRQLTLECECIDSPPEWIVAGDS